MNISEYWSEFGTIPAGADMNTVLDIFSRNKDAPFLAIVDQQERPNGVVSCQDLKDYSRRRSAHEYAWRKPLLFFVRPCLVLSYTVTRDNLLAAVTSNPNPGGLILTQDGRYLALLLNPAIFRLMRASDGQA